MQIRRSKIQLSLGDRQIQHQPRAVGKKFHFPGAGLKDLGCQVGYSTRIQISIANEETRNQQFRARSDVYAY